MSRRLTARVRHPASGITLLELMVALAIVALITGASVRGLRVLSRSNVRDAASKMSGAMRYLFDRASTTGRVHRLVIDFDQGTYYAEVSDDAFYLPRDPETDISRAAEIETLAKEQEERRKKAAEQNAAASAYATDPSSDSASGGFASSLFAGFARGPVDPSKYQPTEWKPKRPQFQPFRESAARPVKLGRVKVLSLYTPRMADPVTHGKGYVYFFPLGFTEAAWVSVGDDKGEGAFTLALHPLTGRVKVYSRYVEPPLAKPVDDEGNLAGGAP